MNVRLASLRGHDQTLHNRIAQGYVRGRYLAEARREQQQVRDEIRRLEARLNRDR
jgi:hypothetical protein